MRRKSRKKLPDRPQAWVDSRRRFHLSHALVQMARELGMNPKKRHAPRGPEGENGPDRVGSGAVQDEGP